MKTLSEIYEKYKGDGSGTGIDGDKFNVHNYGPVYEEVLTPYRELEINVLEVGIASGLSIGMWLEYFTKAKIYGIDIDPARKLQDTDRLITFILDTTKSEQLEQIKNLKFDIIIDDGSHYYLDQIATFNNLYPFLNEGGLFTVEDCQGIDYMENVMSKVPHTKLVVHDLRSRRMRHDDVIFTLWK